MQGFVDQKEWIMSRLSLLALAAAVGLFGSPAKAQTGKVTIVTSFAKDVTDPFKKAFEKAYPGAIRF